MNSIIKAGLFSAMLLVAPAGLRAQTAFICNGKTFNTAVFDRRVQEMMNDIGIPGLSLALIDKGKIVYTRTYGYRRLSDKLKANNETLFEAASLSKTYLVFVAFRLAEQGRLNLDKPLWEYLDFPLLRHDPRYRSITARMVLAHTSGIENWMFMNNPDTLEIRSNPGEQFEYSGAGYNYLAEVIQTILGKPYHEYVAELVNKPLGLTRSFFRFTSNPKTGKPHALPQNFSWGHDVFGNGYGKWRNEEAVPSSANNITAADYARLMLSFFNGRHFTPETMRTLLTPVAPTGKPGFPGFYGPGFELYLPGKDTLVGHGGDNQGFKAQAFYSVVSKRGFVVLTNSDNGKLIMNRLCKETVALDVAGYFDNFFPFHYPGMAMNLFKTYRLHGEPRLKQEMETLQQQGRLEAEALSTIGWFIMDKDTALAARILTQCTQQFPQHPEGFAFLGELYMRMEQYEPAMHALAKARSLSFRWWNNDEKINACNRKIEEQQKRAAYKFTVTGEETIIRTEYYNQARNIQTGYAADTGARELMTHLDHLSYMDYVTDIQQPGTYLISVRVACGLAGTRLQVFSGNNLLATLPVEVTGGWESWATIAAPVTLDRGRQTIRLAGQGGERGFNLNWFSLKPLPAPPGR